MDQHSDTGLSLETDWNIEEGYVVASYRVANGGSAAVVVFDRLYHTLRSGSRSVDHDLAWRRFGQGSVLVIEKLVPPLPADLDVEFPEIPYGRLLEPGHVLDGRAVLPVPVTILQPYPAKPQQAVDIAHEVEFVLGYVVVEENMPARPIAAGDENLLSLDFGWTIQRQRLLRVTTTGIELPIAASGPP